MVDLYKKREDLNEVFEGLDIYEENTLLSDAKTFHIYDNGEYQQSIIIGGITLAAYRNSIIDALKARLHK